MEERSKFLLHDSEFAWIGSDERAINFIWSILKNISDEEINKLIGANGLGGVSTPNGSDVFFDCFVPKRRFSSIKANFEDIVSFFDLWQVHNSLKSSLMAGLKEYWAEVFEKRLVLKWLKVENEDQCKWAWGYVSDRYDIADIFHPITHAEMYWFVFAVLDYSIVGADSKELFAAKFKKAWDQREYRKKQAGRSPLNTYISSESKKQLDSLAEKREEKIYQTLERIIRKAYNESR